MMHPFPMLVNNTVHTTVVKAELACPPKIIPIAQGTYVEVILTSFTML